MSVSRVLTIAGSASQGSAGIQADLKTFQERDVYGMSTITAIVANNPITQQGIFIHSLEQIKAQYYTATELVGMDAIKTGMLFSKEIIKLVANLLKDSTTDNIVVDPVMIGKMGSQLLADDAIEAIKNELIPLAKVITPNRHEAAKLLGVSSINTIDDMKFASKELYQLGCSYVLIKGGPLTEQAVDIIYDGRSYLELTAKRIDTIHTSGAGCSYSAAIAAELAKGKDVHEAVQIGKKYVHAAIEHALSFGRGVGSVNHAAYRAVE